ncbi:MAG: hypothetical protein ACE5LH_03375 [Fidelibacterota bacterium]
MLIARIIKSGSPLYGRIRETARFLDPLFVVRPTLIFPLWITVAAGLGAARSLAIPELYWVTGVNWETVLLFTGLTLMGAGALVQFQIRNRLADESNGTVTALVNWGINPLQMKGWVSPLMTGGLIVLAGVSLYALTNGGEWAPLVSALWTLLAVLTWIVFHAGNRYRWFARPVLGLVTYILTALSLFMAGWSYGSGPFAAGLIHATPYVLLFVAVSILTAVPERKGDEPAGKKTFALRFGVTATTALGAVMVTGAVVTGYLLDDPVISTGSVIVLPFFLVALVFSRMDHVVRAIRYPVLIMAIFVSVRYPWLFAALVILYYLSKFYYYFRFDIDYPTFHAGQD